MPREPNITIRFRRSSPSEFEISVEGNGDVQLQHQTAEALGRLWLEAPGAEAALTIPLADPPARARNGARTKAVEGELDLDGLRERLAEANYEERAVLIAHAAVKGGREGVDANLAEWVCDQLQIAKRPKAWRSTFHGASSSGYLEQSGVYGVWAPTEVGVRLAENGLRRSGARPGPRGGGAKDER